MTNNTFTKFEIGKRYGMNSVCDQDCWWYYTVIDRTACTVTLQDENGKIIKCRMNNKRNEIWGCEAVLPLGNYSMCPVLTAEKEIKTEPKIREEVRKQGTTPDGCEIKVVERYDEMAVNRGCFLIVDGEEFEYGSVISALLMFKDMMNRKPEQPEAKVIPLNAQPKAVKSFVIYQLPVEHDATFMGMDFVREHNIMPKLEDYRVIYRGEVEQGATLDDIYMRFNAGRFPDSYVGRSLSVSDVVLMDGSFNYCDSFGWEQVNF